MAQPLKLIVVSAAAVAAVVLSAWLQTPARLWANTLPGSVRPGTDTLMVDRRRVAQEYSGEVNVNGLRGALSSAQVAAAVPTTTTVTAHSPDPATYGQPVTFTANVSSSFGLPFGNVTFADGVMTLGTGALDASGNATIVTAVLGAGVHSITASYAGKGNFAASTSPGITQTINQAAVNTTLNPSSTALIFVTPLDLTATVTATVGVPTGTVAFKDGTAVVGTGTLSGGVALLTLPALGAGIHSLSVDYGGDANFAGGSSASVPVTVSKAGPSVALAVSQPSLVFGSLLFLTATVTSPAGTPTGTVDFKDGATALASSGLSTGNATLATSALGAGVHTLTANYLGNADFNGGSSSGVVVTVTQAAANVVLVVSQPSLVFGSLLFLTATVTSPAGTPTGTLNFLDGAALLGSSGFSTGSATLATSALAAGVHTLTASYLGNADFITGTSAAMTVTVTQAAAQVTLVSTPAGPVYGSPLFLTATVTSSAGAPTGSVNFRDGATVIGSGSLNGGLATLTTSLLGPGAHVLTADYGGNSNFAGSSSNAVSLAVNKAAPNVVVSVSPTTTVFGSPVVLTATVTSNAGTPTGTVIFQDGTGLLGSNSLNAGMATLTPVALTSGVHTITASYSGNALFVGAPSNSIVVTVTQAAAQVTLVSTPAGSVYGSPLFLTATVTSSAGAPTGTVNFSDGALLIGAGSLAGGSATFATSALGAGVHTVTASYSGNANIAGATSNAVAVTVVQAAAAAVLAASQTTMVYGEPLYLTATVTSGAGAPPGAVDFKDGTAVVGTGTLSGGVALLTAPALNAGGHNLSAQYGGNADFTGAASNGVAVMVNKAGSSTVVASASPDASTVGQPVHLNVTVSPVPPGAGIPTGVVTVSTSGLSCSATLPAGFCDITFNATGVWTLTASYSGDGNFNGGVSPAFAHTVTKSFVYLPVTVQVPPPVNPCGAPQLTWHGGLPAGVSIDALYVQPDGTSQIIYAGAATAPGVYVSRDGGATWPNVGVPSPVMAFAAHPFISTTVYAGTYGGGIYQTTNAGASWSLLTPTPSATIWSLAAVTGPGSTFTLFAGTDNGIYYSDSPIGSWSAATGPIAGKVVYATAVDPENGDLYAATSGSGVFKSTTRGVSWTQTALNSLSVFALATGPSHAVYAGLNGQGVRRSTNGGASWVPLNSGMSTRSVYALVLDPLDAQRLYAGTVGGGVFTSSNGGAGWSAYNVGLSPSDVYALAFSPACYGTLVAGTGNGVWLRDTGSTPR